VVRADGTEPAFANWPPPLDEVWLVHGTMGKVVRAREVTGEVVAAVAVRIGSALNLDGTEDDRTYVLGVDELVGLLGGLMRCGHEAFGQGTLMSAMADSLGISPQDRDRTAEAVERAVGEVRGDE
jgi:hypothetical protein